VQRKNRGIAVLISRFAIRGGEGLLGSSGGGGDGKKWTLLKVGDVLGSVDVIKEGGWNRRIGKNL